MNLNITDKSQLMNEFKELLGQKNDLAGDHCLWVSHDGQVHVDLLDKNNTIKKIEQGGSFKFRKDRMHRGNDYVGQRASKDNEYVEQLLSKIMRDWESGATGYIDY